ncbi:MAG: AraC family transcriptional regulator [Eubacteriales bacterium]|nr:AraC family transcriptional regulator [Eubacteriales bacterium]
MEKNSTFYKISENKQEEKVHGSLEFPCALYPNDNNIFVPWHWHDEYEITYAKKGETLCFAADKKIVLEEGDAVFINSQVLHHNLSSGKSESLYNTIVFNGRMIYGSEESIFWKKYIQPVTAASSLGVIVLSKDVAWQEEALRYIKEAIEEYKNAESGYEFQIREKLTKVFILIYENCRELWEAEIHSNDSEMERMKVMLSFIHEHFDEQIKLSDIAGCANICERECLRSFKKLVGCSPVQYLIRYRILKSCSMLTENKYSITQICIDCGFSSPSYFAKMFKREAGCSPREFISKKQG